ncbi:hypothetical protein HOP60_19755 [Halomonas daqingensis]|uniref:Zn-binding Pro-Ala-Ala-Arg (PAAR) domain-containing protein, incolved in TypeVI secretion n=1 Tax=Billgrantia desiderata TaxID=52021 RepID=A0ABS9B9Y9_9GAMM|nr:hypothetical protein [Halomonas desiderata]MCE8048955.1 hypothetical protein [Halomonas desiderata]
MDLAKVGDKVACSCKGGPHRIVSGASTAKVDGIPVARVGDKSSCGASITSGVAWYPIEGSAAAIDGSATSCGGYVEAASTTVTGSPTGASSQAAGSLARMRSLRVPEIKMTHSGPRLPKTPQKLSTSMSPPKPK